MAKQGDTPVKQVKKEEKLIRDVALDLLKIPHVFRLSVKKRYKSTDMKTLKEWGSIFKGLGILNK